MAGNKCDLFEEEEVPKKEAMEFAKKIGAIFYLTSASSNIGITELFNDLARKFLDPKFTPSNSTGVKLDAQQKPKSKKKCC